MKRLMVITWPPSMSLCISSSVSFISPLLPLMSTNLWFCVFLVEKNPQLVKLYKEKMGQYLQRAEYIKKTVLDVPDEPAAGGTATAAKPKAGPGETPGGEENKEEEKM